MSSIDSLFVYWEFAFHPDQFNEDLVQFTDFTAHVKIVLFLQLLNKKNTKSLLMLVNILRQRKIFCSVGTSVLRTVVASKFSHPASSLSSYRPAHDGE